MLGLHEVALSVEHLELVAFLSALELARNEGWNDIVVETDAKKITSWTTRK